MMPDDSARTGGKKRACMHFALDLGYPTQGPINILHTIGNFNSA